VHATIGDLTKFGKLSIEFNKKMKTDIDIHKLSSENSNLKRRSLDEDNDDFFSDLMSIYVVPNDNWNK
jgi:hypothetical protein